MKKKRADTTTGYGQVTTCPTIVTGYGQGAPCPNTADGCINYYNNQISTLRSVTYETTAVFFKYTSPHLQDQALVIRSSHHGEERSDGYARAAIREAQTKPKTAASDSIHKSTEINNITLRSVTNRMAAVFFKHTACRLQHL
jgi:hypothetical protein